MPVITVCTPLELCYGLKLNCNLQRIMIKPHIVFIRRKKQKKLYRISLEVGTNLNQGFHRKGGFKVRLIWGNNTV